MIDSIVNGISQMAIDAISTLPVIELDIPNGISSWISQVLKFANTFLPVPDLMIILGIRIKIAFFLVAQNIIVRVWQLLPLL